MKKQFKMSFICAMLCIMTFSCFNVQAKSNEENEMDNYEVSCEVIEKEFDTTRQLFEFMKEVYSEDELSYSNENDSGFIDQRDLNGMSEEAYWKSLIGNQITSFPYYEISMKDMRFVFNNNDAFDYFESYNEKHPDLKVMYLEDIEFIHMQDDKHVEIYHLKAVGPNMSEVTDKTEQRSDVRTREQAIEILNKVIEFNGFKNEKKENYNENNHYEELENHIYVNGSFVGREVSFEDSLVKDVDHMIISQVNGYDELIRQYDIQIGEDERKQFTFNDVNHMILNLAYGQLSNDGEEIVIDQKTTNLYGWNPFDEILSDVCHPWSLNFTRDNERINKTESNDLCLKVTEFDYSVGEPKLIYDLSLVIDSNYDETVMPEECADDCIEVTNRFATDKELYDFVKCYSYDCIYRSRLDQRAFAKGELLKFESSDNEIYGADEIVVVDNKTNKIVKKIHLEVHETPVFPSKKADDYKECEDILTMDEAIEIINSAVRNRTFNVGYDRYSDSSYDSSGIYLNGIYLDHEINAEDPFIKENDEFNICEVNRNDEICKCYKIRIDNESYREAVFNDSEDLLLHLHFDELETNQGNLVLKDHNIVFYGWNPFIKFYEYYGLTDHDSRNDQLDNLIRKISEGKPIYLKTLNSNNELVGRAKVRFEQKYDRKEMPKVYSDDYVEEKMCFDDHDEIRQFAFGYYKTHIIDAQLDQRVYVDGILQYLYNRNLMPIPYRVKQLDIVDNKTNEIIKTIKFINEPKFPDVLSHDYEEASRVCTLEEAVHIINQAIKYDGFDYWFDSYHSYIFVDGKYVDEPITVEDERVKGKKEIIISQVNRSEIQKEFKLTIGEDTRTKVVYNDIGQMNINLRYGKLNADQKEIDLKDKHCSVYGWNPFHPGLIVNNGYIQDESRFGYKEMNQFDLKTYKFDYNSGKSVLIDDVQIVIDHHYDETVIPEEYAIDYVEETKQFTTDKDLYYFVQEYSNKHIYSKKLDQRAFAKGELLGIYPRENAIYGADEIIVVDNVTNEIVKKIKLEVNEDMGGKEDINNKFYNAAEQYLERFEISHPLLPEHDRTNLKDMMNYPDVNFEEVIACDLVSEDIVEPCLIQNKTTDKEVLYYNVKCLITDHDALTYEFYKPDVVFGYLGMNPFAEVEVPGYLRDRVKPNSPVTVRSKESENIVYVSEDYKIKFYYLNFGDYSLTFDCDEVEEKSKLPSRAVSDVVVKMANPNGEMTLTVETGMFGKVKSVKDSNGNLYTVSIDEMNVVSMTLNGMRLDHKSCNAILNCIQKQIQEQSNEIIVTDPSVNDDVVNDYIQHVKEKEKNGEQIDGTDRFVLDAINAGKPLSFAMKQEETELSMNEQEFITGKEYQALDVKMQVQVDNDVRNISKLTKPQKVSIPLNDDLKAYKTFDVIHFVQTMNGPSIETIESFSFNSKTKVITFEVDHFSKFAVIGLEKDENEEVNPPLKPTEKPANEDQPNPTIKPEQNDGGSGVVVNETYKTSEGKPNKSKMVEQGDLANTSDPGLLKEVLLFLSAMSVGGYALKKI